MESAHGADVVASICATFTSGDDTVHGDGLERERHLTAVEAAECYVAVAEHIE